MKHSNITVFDTYWYTTFWVIFKWFDFQFKLISKNKSASTDLRLQKIILKTFENYAACIQYCVVIK